MIDYKELLKKYMDHIVKCEGITFVGDIGDTSAKFSFEEAQVLKSMAREVIDEEDND